MIDPRTLVPLDLDTVMASVRKTRKGVVFNEAPCRGSFAADLAAQINEAAFDWLDAPALAVGMPQVPIPFSPVLEKELIPKAARLVSVVRELLGH